MEYNRVEPSRIWHFESSIGRYSRRSRMHICRDQFVTVITEQAKAVRHDLEIFYHEELESLLR
jgi:hypothetical protein